MANKAAEIHPGMTILEIVYRHRRTEPVFRKYDQEAGVCLLCEALFETLEEASVKFGLNLETLVKDLRKAAQAHN